MDIYQLQRLFSRWVGVSPKRFQQFLTANSLRQRLQLGGSQLDLALDEGLSSTSRVHDHFIKLYAMSPEEYRNGGEQLAIRHGVCDSPFGRCHLGLTDKGICWLAFLYPITPAKAISQLQSTWPNADYTREDAAVEQVFDSITQVNGAKAPLYLCVKGSNFQLKVWGALLTIPPGELRSYGAIAQQLGHPRAGRAVGTAIGQNPISWLIPCHRVIRQTGVIGTYRWGHIRKKVMIAHELSHP